MHYKKSHLLKRVVSAALFVTSLGCSGRPADVGFRGPPRYDAQRAGQTAIEWYDSNRDGRLTGNELGNCPGLKAAVSRIDPTGLDGVTAKSITARIEEWEKSKVARVLIFCVVKHNGQPLVGARVRFVPEKFLGEKGEVASGETNEKGEATIGTPPIGSQTEFSAGVAPGFYRVEINKRGAGIPSKYNTETVLGQEVAIDAIYLPIDAEGRIQFDLKY
jgi:hypothetical protein